MLMMLLMMIRVKNQCPSFLCYYHLLALQFIRYLTSLSYARLLSICTLVGFASPFINSRLMIALRMSLYISILFSLASANDFVALFKLITLPLGSNSFYIISDRAGMEKTESPLESESTSHLEVYVYRVPKKNHDAIEQNLKKFVPWFKENGIRIEYFRYENAQKMEGMESIAKTLSASEDEDIWIELQYFRDRKHCEDVYAKMMQDVSLKPLGEEFFGLITQGKSMVTGGFSRLKV